MDIKRLLEVAKIKPDKNLDQHFLQDDKTLEDEVKLANLKKTDTVLEVGGGIGNLTIRLSKKATVLVIERDFSFSRILKAIPNSQLILGDALEILQSMRGRVKFNKVVSNIPYSISQDLVLELFRHQWDTAVLLVQKEFAQKLDSKERLGLLMSDLADVKIIRDVPAGAFYPTAVTSSIVVLKQKKLLDDNFWNFMLELKPNKDVGGVIKGAPASLSKKKVHQLTLSEMKTLYKVAKK